MAEERLQQANNNAEKLTRLAWTMDLKLNDHAAEIGRLVEKVQALERGNPSRED